MAFTPVQLDPIPKHKAGYDFDYSFQFKEDGSPVDLTSYSDITVRLYAASTEVFNHSSSDGDNTISSSSGSNNDIISGTVSDTTMDVEERRYYIDVDGIIGGKKVPLVSSLFEIIDAGVAGTSHEWLINITNSTDTATSERATNILALSVEYKNDAETAKTAAETAESGAQTAQTAAETARTGAETAESNTEAIYDNFDDRYLGAKSSNPSTDNDGDALITGAIYFNTTEDEFRVWNGSAWQDVILDATLNTDTDVSGNSWVLDEDDFSSDSATKVPTQQSTKAYVKDKASLLLSHFDVWDDFVRADADITASPSPNGVTYTELTSVGNINVSNNILQFQDNAPQLLRIDNAFSPATIGHNQIYFEGIAVIGNNPSDNAGAAFIKDVDNFIHVGVSKTKITVKSIIGGVETVELDINLSPTLVFDILLYPFVSSLYRQGTSSNMYLLFQSPILDQTPIKVDLSTYYSDFSNDIYAGFYSDRRGLIVKYKVRGAIN